MNSMTDPEVTYSTIFYVLLSNLYPWLRCHPDLVTGYTMLQWAYRVSLHVHRAYQD